MCGVGGFLLAAGDEWRESYEAELGAMAESLVHRGPDHGASWAERSSGIGLVHRRLAILDLSPTGEQPMTSHDGRFVVVYNGEVYNFATVRKSLDEIRGGISWRGHSDTEVVLEGFATWGIQETLPRLNGMFAIAVWDKQSGELYLVCDRLGKKPLYYGWIGRKFAFASEVRALGQLADWRFSPNRSALAAFLRFGYVPGEGTAFEGISKVLPGSLVRIRRGAHAGTAVVREHYWKPDSLLRQPQEGVARTSKADAAARVESAVNAAIRDRLVADVPIGAMLSGGVDSSLVVALAQGMAGTRIQTFTIGWQDEESSELGAARAIADHLGTLHEELVIAPREVVELVPKVADAYDEPFADASAVPTYLVSRLAASKVKVVLSGDGADELFGGYTRYARNRKLWRLRSVPFVQRAAGIVSRLRAANRSLAWRDSRLATIATSIAEPTFLGFYRSRVSHTQNPNELIAAPSELGTAFDCPQAALDSMLVERRMMYCDLRTYLVDDILVKVDRASMAHGLEVRSPFLDDRVVECAWGLPDASVLGGGQTKQLLRALLDAHVPRHLVDRPKSGFGFPLELWLLGPLRDWARSMIADAQLASSLGLHCGNVAGIVDSFEAGEHRLGGLLWNLVMLSAWHSRIARAP